MALPLSIRKDTSTNLINAQIKQGSIPVTRDCKNIAANDIEPLVVSLLKSSIFSGEMIEKAADAIVETSSSHNSENSSESIKKEITDLDVKISNLMKLLESGLNSDAVRDRITEHEARKKILEQQLKKIIPLPPVSRDVLL
ncbi:MAG: hypothetical protein NC238_02340 [Dehalobacter sp.]|nr:hypothetical protein [Dehalobacter sp.]